MKISKKLLSIFLTICLIVGFLPVEAMANFDPIIGATGILGQVLNEDSGQPPESVIATLRYDDESSDIFDVTARCEVDSDGKFQFTYHDEGGAFPAGNYTLTFTSSYYMTKTVPVQITGDSGSEIVQVYLTPGGSIFGTVTDAETGAALSGVTVSAVSNGAVTQTDDTDATGKYCLKVKAGTYTIEFFKTNYQTVSLTRSFGPGGDVHFGEDDVQLIPGEDNHPEIIASGDCGDNLFWSLDVDGRLIVSGMGEMEYSPWRDYSKSIKTVIIADGITNIDSYAFSRCSNLTSIVIPNSVCNIGYYAFQECTNLSQLTLPDSLIEIDSGAFASSGLTNIVIPQGASINYSSGIFSNCQKLEQATILGNITHIEENVFRDCVSLTNVIIPDSVTSIGVRAFSGCSKLANIKLPNKLVNIENSAFYGCGLTNIIVPNGVTHIGNYTFSGCSELVNVTLPNGLTDIGEGAFKYCRKLISIIIPPCITEIKDDTFFTCDLSKGITIPRGVTKIGNDVFVNCNFSSITIPDTITYIGISAFSPCNELKHVYYSGSEGQWQAIVMYGDNDDLTSATIHYNSAGNIQYGVDNKVIKSTDVLEKYADDWYTAYTNYTEAVEKALQNFAASSQPSRAEVIAQQKQTMMEEDAKTGWRGTKYIYSPAGFFNDEVKDAAYEALATFLYDKISATPSLNLSNIKPTDMSGPKLVNKVYNAIGSDSAKYTFGKVTVKIATSGIGQIGFGLLTCSAPGMMMSEDYALCSSTEKCNEAIRSFMREMMGLENAALWEVVNATCKDILGQPLDKLTEKYLSKYINSHFSKLPKNIGNLASTLNSCYNYYQYVKKIVGWANADTAPENILAAMQGFEFTDSTVSDSAAKKSLKLLSKATSNLNYAYLYYLNGTLDESKIVTWWNNTKIWLDDIKQKFTITCPVNITVYNSAGSPIGYVGEDDIWCDENLLHIEESGGAKIIYAFTDDTLSFGITGNEYGTMGFSAETYDEKGQPLGRTNFYDLPLAPDTAISAIDTAGNASGGAIYSLTVDGTTVQADEVLLPEKNGEAEIICTSTDGGSVNGAGIYVRGDATVLHAQPEDGYTFVGWYQENTLVETSRIYEFTARENLTLQAKFAAVNTAPISVWLTEDRSVANWTDSNDLLAEGAVIFAATCNSSGKMTDVAYGVLGDGSIMFNKELSTGWEIFFLAPNTYVPLCEKVVLQ